MMEAGPLSAPGATPATVFVAVATAHVLAVMSPGPDFVMVTRQTLAYGRGAGTLTALGIASAISFHIAYGLFGLAWAIHRYPPLLLGLRLGGAVLLLWIGWGALRAAPTDAGTTAETPAARGSRAQFGIGFLTNLLNAKAMLFFVALGTAAAAGTLTVGLRLALGGWMVATTAVWFCFLAWTLGHPRVRERLLAWRHWIDRVMGAILVLLGLGMLAAGLAALA
jgi:threonine/homoserine/homoserine lactone efflux protein